MVFFQNITPSTSPLVEQTEQQSLFCACPARTTEYCSHLTAIILLSFFKVSRSSSSSSSSYIMEPIQCSWFARSLSSSPTLFLWQSRSISSRTCTSLSIYPTTPTRRTRTPLDSPLGKTLILIEDEEKTPLYVISIKSTSEKKHKKK